MMLKERLAQAIDLAGPDAKDAHLATSLTVGEARLILALLEASQYAYALLHDLKQGKSEEGRNLLTAIGEMEGP